MLLAMVVLTGGCRLPMPPIDPGGLSNLGKSLPAPSDGQSPAVSPMVIVNGWALGCLHGGPGNWDAWTKAVSRRYSPSHGVHVFTYDACASNAESASSLSRFIAGVRASTGAPRVRLAAVSMGSLAARWCLRFLDCEKQVSAFASMAGANHGTLWTFACPAQFWSDACAEMSPTSSFLATLNSEDEVNSEVPFGTWNSWCDAVIVPHTSTFLAGAENHDLPACIGHAGWIHDRTVIDGILDWFDRVDPPTASLDSAA